MNLKITKKDVFLLLLAISVLMAITAVDGFWLDKKIEFVLPVVAVGIVLSVMVELYRRLNARLDQARRLQEQDYRQLESLMSLFMTLKPALPLPQTRAWAASPDLLKKIIEVIFTEKPRLVVEASSGVSTLIIAYGLKQLGHGNVVSLEHDAKFAAMSQKLITFHGLDDFATIIYAPLKEIMHNGQNWQWYDIANLRLEHPIDLLVIDGPPGHIQTLSRYPALPQLYNYLNAKALIILDDGDREDEKRIVARWQKEFDHLVFESLELEKGAFLIHKNNPLGANASATGDAE